GASDTLEAPVMIGGPSRTRTLDPLIKSHFGQAASDTIAQNPLRSRGWNALGRSRFCALLDAAFAPALTRSHPLGGRLMSGPAGADPDPSGAERRQGSDGLPRLLLSQTHS